MKRRTPCDQCDFPAPHLVAYSNGADAYLCGGCVADERSRGFRLSIVGFPPRNPTPAERGRVQDSTRRAENARLQTWRLA